MKLNIRAFALAAGIVWAVGCLFMGLTALVCPWAVPFVKAVGTMYVGYAPTVAGSLIGAAWAFVDAGVGAALLAWLYNRFTK